MNKQPDITDATREAFVEAFCTLTLKYPERKITIKEITDLAGYNRTTFYRYFCDTVAVVEYIEDCIIDELMEKLKNRGKRGKFYDMYFQIIMEIVHNNEKQARVVTHENYRAHWIDKLIERQLPVWQQLYHVQELSGSARFTALIYFSGIFSAIGAWLNDPAAITEEELFHIIRQLAEKWFGPQLLQFE